MENNLIKKELIHISSVRIGDTVEHHGEIKTVGKGNLKYSSFMGYSLWGDSYICNHKKVIKIIFPIFKNGIRIN